VPFLLNSRGAKCLPLSVTLTKHLAASLHSNKNHDNKTTRHKIRYNVKVRDEKMKHKFQKNLKLRKCKNISEFNIVLMGIWPIP